MLAFWLLKKKVVVFVLEKRDVCVCVCMYVPGTQMTLVLIGV